MKGEAEIQMHMATWIKTATMHKNVPPIMISPVPISIKAALIQPKIFLIIMYNPSSNSLHIKQTFYKTSLTENINQHKKLQSINI